MKISETIKSVRDSISAARKGGKKIGFVPTMGALHIGHISLIEAAVKQCDFVVVSIFVNPTQFGIGEDFEKYPRPLQADLEICKKAGVNIVFAPSIKEMYPNENLTSVNVEKITESLCGKSRQGHFRGVATVCTKLFNIVTPDFAYFGQKDAQQAVVVRQMVCDLNMPVEIVVCPTIREKDGLAVSSRNQYLSRQQKKDAALIYKSLQKCRQMILAGEADISVIIEGIGQILSQSPAIEIEYINIVDAQSLQNVTKISGKILVAIAVKIGSTRLIDNILVDTNE